MISRIVAGALLLWMLGFAWFAIAMPGPADDRTTDAIVVLTGGPGRIQRGLHLLERNKAKRMLVSGADRRVRPAEFAEAYGAPLKLVDCCVDLGNEAVDTRSNADETVEWVTRHHYRSVRLVTTDWHMRRARFELSRVLGGNVLLLADAVPSEPGLGVLFTEYHKYLLRRVAAPLGI
ncbi:MULTISPECIES: YdcF family protein [Sphingomonadales]|uniref:YdcF family protein n=2 Tax=Edaphosphingomonas TaxID=3423724 RepID=A0A2T4I447_9SPHN|nr:MULTISPECIES: YdcF family protein [Sphingomonas]AGH50632.1 hypothetical protein G432_14565 [Sphingomonas sp. MM-1]MDX3883818.1 YdcF family protein [Sphingomonas sp.]OHT19077.1 hypothetical protein BHE75_01059 [Sphingomonas haloaromaticamans]PTD24180.1 YdcF family protein [Sphingomonas fennica]